MSQNDFVIDNDTANAARLDIQSAFQALATNNSGASAPPTPYANQWWYETDTNLLKIRNEANTSWINVAYINQGTGKFEVLDDTRVVNTGGSQTGLLGDQATTTWQSGTGTTDSLVSPAKVKAAIDSLVPDAPTTAGGVGTYALLNRDFGPTSISFGVDYAASGLMYLTAQTIYGGALAIQSTGTRPTETPFGTWRAMGVSPNSINTGWYPAQLFLRIS